MKRNKSGIVLVICVICLLALSVMAVSFVRHSTFQRVSSDNNIAALDAKLAAFAGIDHSVAVAFEQIQERGAIREQGIFYPHQPGEKNYDLALASQNFQQQDFSLADNSKGLSLTLPEEIQDQTKIIQRFAFSGVVGRVSNGKILGRYADNGNSYALKIINLASKWNVNSHISEDAAKQIDSNKVAFKILQSLATKCGIANPQQVATIIRNPDSNEVPQYRSIEDVAQLLEAIPEDSIVLQKFLDNLCVHSWIDPSTSCKLENPRSAPATYYKEQRCPVDINTASVELLESLVENIRASVVFFSSEIDASNDPPGLRSDFTSSTETVIEHTKISKVIDFSLSDVTAIVATLIQNRATTAITHFDQVQQIIDTLDLDVFPSAEEINEQQWLQACRDTLKSNFDANTIDNFWNPNFSVYRRVVKADLFVAEEATHTSELCFSSQGRLEITSLGRVITPKGIVVASVSVKNIVKLYDILQHTTQDNFADGLFLNTLSQPGRHNAERDTMSGYVEVAAISNTPISGAQSLFQTNFSTLATAPIARMISRNLTAMQKTATMRDPQNNVANDGLFSKLLQYLADDGTLQPRYYAESSIENNFVSDPGDDGVAKPHRNANPARDPQQNIVTQGSNNLSKVGNYRGSIEMWVKLDVNEGESLECGLLSIHQTGIERFSKVFKDFQLEDLVDEQIPFKEGTQTLLFKKPDNTLRFSRVYFCGFFDGSGNYYGSKHLRDGDFQRIYPRRDVVIDINWKPHTWHHVVISWDDTKGDFSNPGEGLSLVIDGQTITDAQYILGPNATETSPNFCVLSEFDEGQLASNYDHTRNTMDGIMWAGIHKKQGSLNDLSKGAVYKHSSTVDYIANATIGEVISYDSETIKSDFVFREKRERFPATASYENNFVISPEIPPNAFWGPLRWTAFPSHLNSENKPVLSISVDVSQEANLYQKELESFASTDAGEKLLPSKFTKIDSDQTIKYTAQFQTPPHEEMVTNQQGSYSAALESVELLVMSRQDLLLIIQ